MGRCQQCLELYLIPSPEGEVEAQEVKRQMVFLEWGFLMDLQGTVGF